MRRLLLFPLLMAACEISTNPSSDPEIPRLRWLFQMPSVHDVPTDSTIPARGEYLLCEDTLKNGTICNFRGISGRYEEAFDASFLDTPDSTIQWPKREHIGPLLVGRVP